VTEPDSDGVRARVLPGGFVVSDDPRLVDLDAVWQFLKSEAYWGRDRSLADLEAQIANAWRVVGVYTDDAAADQVGFARAWSDTVRNAYLADVYVLGSHRGRGLGTALVRHMVDDGPGADFRWLLHTADAHDLYARFGFDRPDRTLLERPAGGSGTVTS
jgi:GNAT superfamily N-acetyltransferase